MTKPTPATAPAAAQQHVFTVYQHGTEYKVQAEDFEIDQQGVHFVVNAGTEQAVVVAFASHPAIVVQHRPGAPVEGMAA